MAGFQMDDEKAFEVEGYEDESMEIEDYGDEDAQWNGLVLDSFPFDDLEKLIDYEPEGHHPVHLGDKLGEDGRYKVVHKLGSGGFANVWMCRDLKSPSYKYVALKILIAWVKEEDCRELRTLDLKEQNADAEVGGRHICLPQADFRIDGPNGRHICFVYPVLGPRISWLWKPSADAGTTLRQIALQAVQGMGALHAHGVCHGDFTPKNLLLQMSSLEGFSEDQLCQNFGSPVQIAVKTEDVETPSDPSAPRYLVRPIDFSTPSTAALVSREASLIDFGESYQVSSPPEELGTPVYYRSPELQLDGTKGLGADIWALACTLFELRTGRKLFNLFEDDKDDHLYHMVLLLGPLPEPWWTEWEGRNTMFEDEPDAQGRAVKKSAEDESSSGTAFEPRSIRELLARNLPPSSMEDCVDNGDHVIWKGIATDKWLEIEQAEIEVFADLLEKMMRYKPEERLSAEEVAKHPWFKFGHQT